MSTMLRSSGKSVTVWVLLAMIVLGLGGYNVSNFSGRTQAIGSVGESEITVTEYAQALRQEMNAAASQIGHPLSMAEARSLGLDRAVQMQLFAAAGLSEQARRLELSVGDGEVGKQIRTARPFQNTEGNFDRAVYREALRQQGLTEFEFETRLRTDISRSILQGAVAGGVTAPAALVSAYTTYLGETRDIATVEITEDAVKAALGTPDDAALTAYYEAHLAEFTKPETREISYVWLTPEMLKDKVTVDEATLKATYDERRSEYVQPERRKLAKLVFPTMAEASAAKAKLDAGTATLADLAQERGLAAADIEAGEVTKDQVGGAAGDAVFAATSGIVGPVETDLGPAIFAIESVVPGEETTFEEARPDLLAELSMDKARRLVADKTSDLEDRLASGATLEDMEKETEMEMGHVSMAPDTADGIAAYESFRTVAAKLTAEDFPELANLEDGGIFAARLDGITPAAPIPFADCRDAVAESWRNAEVLKAKAAQAQQIAEAVAAGKSLAAQGLAPKLTAKLQRGGFVEGAPQNLAQTAFATAAGKAAAVSDAAKVFVVEVQAIHAVDPNDAMVRQMREGFGAQLGQMIGTDLVNFYARAAQTEAGIQLDSAVINAVQAQIQ